MAEHLAKEGPSPELNMYTSTARSLIALAVTAAILACGGQGQAPLAPLDETQLVELSTDIIVTDVFGDDALGFNEEGELWLMNIRTGDLRRLTNDGHPKWAAVLSDDHVAWIDQRREVQLPGYSDALFSSDVYVRNRHTGEERRITDAPASRHGLRISGSHLVWQDNREGLLEDRRWDFDIYGYDLEGDVEVPVAVTPGREDAPAIHGDTVVWTHNPNKPPRGLRVPGSTAKPDNRFNIFSYNLATEERQPLVETGEHNVTPSIHGGLLVWQRFRGENESDIVLLDLGTGEQKVIGAGGRTESRPLISEEYVIWRVAETCDVGGFPGFRELFRSKVSTGVYAYEIRTEELRRFSRDKEPSALLSGNTALITEGCHRITRQYAVLLD